MSDPTATGQTDAELLRRHVAGDGSAFGELVRRHQDRLWAVALRTLGDPEEAADALQDALLAAFRRAESFRGEAQVTTWLHRIVVNACLDRVRRRRLQVVQPLTEGDEAEVALPASEADSAETRERRQDILAALRQLTVEQRAAIVLVDIEGFSVEEAAQVLSCAAGTVKSRCSRGRARLLPMLEHLREGPAADPEPRGNRGGAGRVTPSMSRLESDQRERLDRAAPEGGLPA